MSRAGTGGWVVLGAPLDSSGSGRGERRAPAALRAAGLVDALDAEDGGDADALLTDPVRDPVTGVIGFEGLRRASEGLRRALDPLLDAPRRPLVVGGDCAVMLGIAAALRGRHARPGLWFVDGHADFYDGRSSPSGEAADMDLAMVTGHGPEGLDDLAPAPMVPASAVALLGHRRAEDDPDVKEELGFLPPELFHLDATAVLQQGPAAVAEEAERHVTDAADVTWLHLDLDVLDERAMPAVTYPQPAGLDWHAATALLTPLAASPTLAGVSVADFNPDRDPDGTCATRVISLLTEMLR